MNKLLYINIDDVEKTYNHENTTEENTNGIAVLNYHFSMMKKLKVMLLNVIK